MLTFLNLCDKNKNAFSIAKIYLDYELYNKVECFVAKEFNSKRMKLMSLTCLFVSSLAGYLSCPPPPLQYLAVHQCGTSLSCLKQT